MKLIPLTQNKYALVDDWDYGWLSKFKWHATKIGRSRTWYACTNYNTGTTRTIVRMHQLLCPTASDVDHKNGNGLFNSRGNLRESTRSQNLGNRAKTVGFCTSRYKGVSWSKRNNRWAVYIGGTAATAKKRFCGYFACETEAAKAYDKAALVMYGEFARLNFPLLLPGRTTAV